MTALVLADGFVNPAGNSLSCALASGGGHPGILVRVELYNESVR